MATLVKSFAIQGIDGYRVDIEVTTLDGQPMLSIIGLGDLAVKEAGERIQAAMDSCGYDFPKKKVIINLAPGDKKKKGSHFDLAMAIALLQETNTIAAKQLEQFGLIGELALNGNIRSCTGILPMIMSAGQNGIQKVIVPRSNLKEAKLVRNIEVYGFEKLPDVIRFLEGKSTGDVMNQREETQPDVFREYALDFADVKGQNDLIEAVVLAAAGGHNMLMIGEPGCGKTMLAERIPTILPKMTEEESLEVTKIYSISVMHRDSMKFRKDSGIIHTKPAMLWVDAKECK